MKPKINLPSGASIVIETTEALTVIDVNSGKFTGGRNLEDTILKTNMEAADEIARQVRLRDIGGIIVVDFIDMSSDSSRDKVVRAMEDSLRRDRTRATIQSFSNLGLLEFTRKRIGKDLGAQLRGTCPTCLGMGSVMSSQSVAIETFRQIREAGARAAGGEVVVHVAPTVAVQMDFWYGEECDELARSIGHPIHVRVDPMIHPEKARVETVAGFKKAGTHIVRVGDEHDVDLLPGRLPNPTSAAAVVEGRIVEVENAINSAGTFARVRILDVDDDTDYVLAELMTAGAKAGRRRKPAAAARRGALTAAEQTRQLRELAEDAARQSAARPPIGISPVSEEDEAQDKALRAERKGEAAPDAIIIGAGEPQQELDGDGRRKRRRRRRGGRGRGQGEKPAAVFTPPPVEEPAAAAASAVSADGAGEHRRRRRRRGRRGRGLGHAPGAMPERHIFEVASDGVAHPTGATAAPEPSRAIARRSPAPAPAVEPPPPSLSVPAEEPKRTKPVRRRKTAATGKVAGELEGTASPLALTAAEAKPKRTRKTAVKAEKKTPAEPKPKRARTPTKRAASSRKKSSP